MNENDDLYKQSTIKMEDSSQRIKDLDAKSKMYKFNKK